MKRKNILCILAAAVCLFSAVNATLAAWRVSDPSTQAISIASLSGQIVEKYEEETELKPGNHVEKIVNVKNTGSSDSVIRVKIEKAWGKGRTPEGVLISDSSFPTDNILINFNTKLWYYNAADGFYYYKGVLRPGETTTEPLLDSFFVSKDVGAEYNGMTADIVVKLECIQAAADAISVWNMSFDTLGIIYQTAQQAAEPSKVEFHGKNNGFSFNPASTDLFISFKDLLPGETRNQAITVTNSASSQSEIYLRAEIADQTKATPETLELINRLLKEYVTVVVTAPDGTVVYSGPVWGNPTADASTPDSMRYDFSLGKFSAGETKNLSVQLQVNPLVDNEYQSLWGYIRWVWSAEGEETPVDPPKTGDETNMYLYFGIMLASGFILIVLLRSRKKEQEKAKKQAIQ